MAPKIDFTKPLATPLTGPTGGSPQNATSSTMTPGERQRRWNANNLDVNGGLRGPANSPNNTSGVVEDDVSGVDAKGSRNSPPPPPRSPSEEQRYNSAARTADTTVAMYNPRGLGNQSKYKQSQGNVVPGSLQAKIEAERAIGKSDPWTGWNVKRNETRPVLHSMKGADGTTYYQRIDGKAGTARYWSVDSSGNRTEYTGDDKVSARDQINAARKNADLEAKKNYWRSRGVQFGETDEKGNFTGKFENLTAEGARAEYERKFGDAERAVREGRVPEGVSVARAQRELDRERFAWSKSGEGREQYNYEITRAIFDRLGSFGDNADNIELIRSAKMTYSFENTMYGTLGPERTVRDEEANEAMKAAKAKQNKDQKKKNRSRQAGI